MNKENGVTLVEIVIAIAIVVILFGGIYTAYIAILDAITNSVSRSDAAAIMNREVEIIRNLPYGSVGTEGGIPSGSLAQLKEVTSTSGLVFDVRITVRNIDDPFDGTVVSVPADTAPADYKSAEIEVSCKTCTHFIPLTLTTTVAPKDLESALTGGSLFINVFDAAGVPVQAANVHLVNASVTPAIDLLDVTNASGVLQLVGVPTSTQAYQITVTKAGFSTDETYPSSLITNPNPVKPHATVQAQSLTQISFAIDKISSLSVKSSDNFCTAIPSRPFTLVGSKLIGINPDVAKFSTSSITDGGGVKNFSSMEWDSYEVTASVSGYDIMGYTPDRAFAIDPDTSAEARMILTPSTVRSLMVTVRDAGNGSGVSGATVALSNGAGYSAARITGRNTIIETDWSGGNYIAQSGGINTESLPGGMRLSGPPYSTSTVDRLISKTIDLGSSSSTLYTISWNPVSQPALTNLSFQVATNNDNATWNYVGPDGAPGTYYTVNGSNIPAAVGIGNRYLRYKVYMSTQDENISPSLDDID
ncbi:MAG: carboxypeptidase-like regulatory domain-containing protein, partial [Candidatus Liptonbacteria bacterium]